LLEIVARVPITPIFLFDESCNAIDAPGSIIPIIGRLNLLFNSGIATDEAVLHATIIAFTSLLKRKLVF